MNKILITGADGFIGSHLTEYLLNKGFKIKAMVYYNAFNHLGLLKYINNHKNLEIIKGDIRDFFLLKEQVKDTDIIINLAALIGIPYSYKASYSYVETNIIGTLNILELLKEKKIKQCIFLSTSEVYGTAQHTPMNELHPINPLSPYAASKAGADAMINSYIKSFNIPATILRPFNTYGPRQSLRAVIPTIITQAIKSKTIKLGRIDTFRDFNFIEDTIKGIFLAINNKKTIHKTINIGSGKMYSIEEIIKIVEVISNKNLKIKIENKRKRPFTSEVKKLMSDINSAKNILHYYPSVNIYKGIKKTYSWFEKNINSVYEDSYII